MGKQVKEIAKASLSAAEYKGRRKNRVYEDQVWTYARSTGNSPWKDPSNPPIGESDFHP